MNLVIELPDDEAAALKARAEKHGVSAEEFARLLLERDLKRDEQRRSNVKMRHISDVMAEIMGNKNFE